MSEELTVRPSTRRAVFSLVLCLAFLAAVVWMWRSVVPNAASWILLVGVLPFIAPLSGWLDSKRTALTVRDGVARYRHGLVSQTTRAVELRKLQDIRVERTLMQRVWGLGTLVLETAGESSRISIADIDRPQQTADWILNASRQEGSARAGA